MLKTNQITATLILLVMLTTACSSTPAESPTLVPTNTLSPPASTPIPSPTYTPLPLPTATTIPNRYPDARGYAQFIFHPPSGQIIMYGGEANQRASHKDTWSFNTATNIWTDLDPEVHPSNVGGATAAYDVESDKIIFYFSTRLSNTAPNGLIRLSQTWAFDVATNTWSDLMPGKSPFGLMGARMAYDSESDRIILFGGADFTIFPGSPYFDETWAYDYNTNTWEQMESQQSPLRRSYFGFTYDTSVDRILAFGGNLHDDDKDRKGEMWSYDYNSDSWSQIIYSGEVLDAHHPNMVYDSTSNRSFYYVSRDFWSFDFESSTWTQLDSIPETSGRYFLSMAFDSTTGKLVIFGGGPAGLKYDNRTWVFATISAAWMQIEQPDTEN